MTALAATFAAPSAQPADAAGFAMDLYFRAGYERQVDGRTCTAASTAMMLNFAAGRDLSFSQRTILRYAQSRDALRDWRQRGSDPLGWSRALTYYSGFTSAPTTYVWEAHEKKRRALKRAAWLIATTGRPVGLVTWSGRHAVVMTGFRATADPRSGRFKLTEVAISDPLRPAHRWYSLAGVSFSRYRELDATRRYDRAWYGRYIIVGPQAPPMPEPTPTPTPTPEPEPDATPPPTPAPDAAPTPTPDPEPEATPTPAPEATPPAPEATPTPEATPEPAPAEAAAP